MEYYERIKNLRIDTDHSQKQADYIMGLPEGMPYGIGVIIFVIKYIEKR